MRTRNRRYFWRILLVALLLGWDNASAADIPLTTALMEQYKLQVGMKITKENADAVNAGFEGDVKKGLEGKTISLTGEVKMFRDSPQIEISKPDQIKVEAEKEENPAEEKKPE